MFTEAQNIFVYELNNLMYTFDIYIAVENKNSRMSIDISF